MNASWELKTKLTNCFLQFSKDLRTSSYNPIAPIYASMQGDGKIFFENGEKCIGPYEDRSGRRATWLIPYASSDQKCQDSKSRFHLVCKYNAVFLKTSCHCGHNSKIVLAMWMQNL